MANFVEKENIFLRIAKYLFPWKGDKPAEIIRKCIFLGAAVVLIVSLVMIISFYGSTAQDNKLNEQISSLYHGSASVTIDPEAVDPDDVDMLQDLIVAAVNEAMRKATEDAASQMSKLTGGLNLPF